MIHDHFHPGFRIFVLGAGFSRPAGLPLASELFAEVIARIEKEGGKETKFHRDLHNYLEYREACHAVRPDAPVDLEELLSFLDIEHFLELKGSDTWSNEGNEAQLMIRKAIGQTIHSRTPSADRLPESFYRFADRLSTNDIVITFNYDVVLERALEHVGKPYRLFMDRFKEIGKHANIVDSSIEEVTVLKLHGSLDWFDDRGFLESKQALLEQGVKNPRVHSVFDDPERYEARPIVDGPRSPDDPLLHIHRIRRVDDYYQQDRGFNSPFILSPSHVKFVYAAPLLSLWRGIGRAGAYNLGVSVIGFSLPAHDEYIRVALFQMISNYQQSWWDGKMIDGLVKDDVRLVDYRTDAAGVAEFKRRYSFVNPKRADFFFDGFSNDAVSFLFDAPRIPPAAECGQLSG